MSSFVKHSSTANVDSERSCPPFAKIITAILLIRRLLIHEAVCHLVQSLRGSPEPVGPHDSHRGLFVDARKGSYGSVTPQELHLRVPVRIAEQDGTGVARLAEGLVIDRFTRDAVRLSTVLGLGVLLSPVGVADLCHGVFGTNILDAGDVYEVCDFGFWTLVQRKCAMSKAMSVHLFRMECLWEVGRKLVEL